MLAFLGGLPVTIPVGAWEASTIGIGEITPGVIAGVLFIGVISTALAMFLWNSAFAFVSAGIASEQLDPKNICVDAKALLRQEKMGRTAEELEELFLPPHPARKGREIPIQTLYTRLGLTPYDRKADFVRIAADQLEYSGARRKAVYSGSARVRQSEGWVEADTVTVSFAAERGDIEEVESLGKVRFEFHGKDRDGLPVSVTGSADRAVYEPKAHDFWLYGVQAPAQVTRPGTQGGTTTGRVLRYRLDDGTLSVESGGRGRARIRTP